MPYLLSLPSASLVSLTPSWSLPLESLTSPRDSLRVQGRSPLICETEGNVGDRQFRADATVDTCGPPGIGEPSAPDMGGFRPHFSTGES